MPAVSAGEGGSNAPHLGQTQEPAQSAPVQPQAQGEAAFPVQPVQAAQAPAPVAAPVAAQPAAAYPGQPAWYNEEVEVAGISGKTYKLGQLTDSYGNAVRKITEQAEKIKQREPLAQYGEQIANRYHTDPNFREQYNQLMGVGGGSPDQSYGASQPYQGQAYAPAAPDPHYLELEAKVNSMENERQLRQVESEGNPLNPEMAARVIEETPVGGNMRAKYFEIYGDQAFNHRLNSALARQAEQIAANGGFVPGLPQSVSPPVPSRAEEVAAMSPEEKRMAAVDALASVLPSNRY